MFYVPGKRNMSMLLTCFALIAEAKQNCEVFLPISAKIKQLKHWLQVNMFASHFVKSRTRLISMSKKNFQYIPWGKARIFFKDSPPKLPVRNDYHLVLWPWSSMEYQKMLEFLFKLEWSWNGQFCLCLWFTNLNTPLPWLLPKTTCYFVEWCLWELNLGNHFFAKQKLKGSWGSEGLRYGCEAPGENFHIYI